MSADDIKLLPCPFCGGIPSFSHTKDDGRYIECGGCGASTNLRYACGDDPNPLLAEQWNRRALSPQGDAKRLDFIAEHGTGVRRSDYAKRNLIVWTDDFPVEGAGRAANLRNAIDAARSTPATHPKETQ